MQWQDLVFSIGNLVFAIALIPSLISKNKPAFTTSFIIGLVLIAFAVAYASMNMWLSLVMVTISAGLWLILAYQKYRQDRTINSND